MSRLELISFKRGRLSRHHSWCHSRGNLGLEEDEDEDEQRRYTAGTHHPDWEVFFLAHGVDEPASCFGVGHLNTFWHNQFLREDRMMK